MILIYIFLIVLFLLLIWMKYFRRSFLLLFVKKREIVTLLEIREIEYEQPTERYNLLYVFPELLVNSNSQTKSIRLKKNYSTSKLSQFGLERSKNDFAWNALEIGQEIELIYSYLSSEPIFLRNDN